MQDAVRKEKEARRKRLKEIAAAEQAEQNNSRITMQRWRQKFSGNKNADKMAHTLKKLHLVSRKLSLDNYSLLLFFCQL